MDIFSKIQDDGMEREGVVVGRGRVLKLSYVCKDCSVVLTRNSFVSLSG